MANYPKGSVWRRWDLHVHAPETKLADQYKGYDDNLAEFVRRIEECAVDVIGITDYFSIDGYVTFVEKFKNLYPKSRKVIFANVEFRLSETIGKSGTHPDLHIIFDISKSGCSVDDVREFLDKLVLYEKGKDGKLQYCSSLKTEADFKAASVSKRDILAALEANFGEKKPYLIAFPANNDGIRSTINSPRNRRISDELDRNSDLFFGKTENRDYFLRSDRYESGISKAKPVVFGSDAHSFEDLERIDNQQEGFEVTWIKADPTFEGLKQILFEPDERVWIGSQPREKREPSRIITKLKTENRPEWLDWQNEVELNSGLVCIIGNKGSGKTGLLDVIASAAGGIAPDSDGSFIKKVKDILAERETKASLSWQNGDGGEMVSVANQEDNDDEKVTYLTQQFVEELCAVDTDNKKLSDEIERVVFEKIPEEERLRSSNFEGLRDKKLGRVIQSRDERHNELTEHIKSWCELQQKLQNMPEMKGKLARHKKELKDIEMPQAGATDMQVVSDEIERLTESEANLSREIGEINSQLSELDEICATVEGQLRKNEKFFEQISNRLDPFGLPPEEIAQFKLSFVGDPLKVLSKKQKELEAKVLEKTGQPDAQTEETLTGVRKILSEKRDKLKIDKALEQSIEEKVKLKNKTKSKIKKLKDEIEDIEKEDKKLPAIKEGLLAAYISLFETYGDEEAVDEDLYSSLKTEIGVKNSRFEVNIVRTTGTSDWSEGLLSMLDLRSAKDEAEAIETHAATLEKLWQNGGNASDLREKIWGLIEEAKAASYDGLNGKLKTQSSYEKFLSALLSLSHISVSYSLKYDELPLESMSPGTKGLALMILYLQLNEHDRRPLLVDQPEENLDNESIYDNLRAFFREAKKRRQIIMVTHNPNLVVNTDADQVIVTKIEQSESGNPPTLSFSSGAIENPAIREKICKILEGGTDAFKTRENRYEL